VTPRFNAIIIDGWTVRPELNTITRGEDVVRVEPKVMEVLLRLAESPGRVVSKVELFDSVWPGVVVGDDSLTRAISELRRALGDSTRSPRIIETVPKRGYRLIAAAISVVALPATSSAESATARPPAEPPPSLSRTQATGTEPRAEDGSPVKGIATIAMLLAVSLAAVLWPRPWTMPGPATRPALVLVESFENATTRAALGETITGLIEQEIARTGRLAVVSDSHLAAVLGRMRRPAGRMRDVATAREIVARDDQIVALVTGRITEDADHVVVSVHLTDARGEPLASFAFHGATVQELRDTLRAASRFDAVWDFSAHPPLRLPPVTTSSFQALQLFARAVETADSRWASITGPWDTVIEQLTEAIRIDPDFAMAKVWLAMVLRIADEGRLSYAGGEPMPPAVYRQLAAESLDGADDVSIPEQLFIKGAASMLLEREEQALAALEVLQATAPSFQELRTRVLLSQLYYSQASWPSMTEQAVAIAELLPDDFDANADAAMAIASSGGGLDQAGPYAATARTLLTPEVGRRENSCWRAAWIAHFDAFERWSAGDVVATAERLRAIEATISTEVEGLRDALATTNGVLWLALGRIEDARRVFRLVGHSGQLELNLSRIPEVFDDWAAVVEHLDRLGWAHDPVPFAQAGLFARANAIVAGGYSWGPHRQVARGLEAAAGGRFPEATKELQQAVDRLRNRPTDPFYVASLALADVWESAGNRLQAVRVLEETVATRPAFGTTGPAGAAWIKAQVRLARAYRRAGRSDEAENLAGRVRALLSLADPGFPLLAQLESGGP